MQYKLKNNTDMTKQFNTTFGEKFKVSFNFRANTMRVYELLGSKVWHKTFLVSSLTKQEIEEIAFKFKGDDLRTFLIENEKTSIWR